MELNILAVGDVVADSGLDFLCRHLRTLRTLHQVAFCIVNGENASNLGLTPKQADAIFDAGADVITLGNHSFSRREIVPYLDDCSYILRPANLPPQLPGRGFGVFDSRGGPIAVMNLIGRCGMDFGPDNPFLLADHLLKTCSAKLVFLDFHAEATSEKLAMGWYLDGRITAMWGTHTHVPTADAQLLPKGTGYITDLGMTGPKDSILGIKPQLSIQKFRGDLPQRYEPAPGPCKLEGCLFTCDSETGRCTEVSPIRIYD